jgi:hypothetical protein
VTVPSIYPSYLSAFYGPTSYPEASGSGYILSEVTDDYLKHYLIERYERDFILYGFSTSGGAGRGGTFGGQNIMGTNWGLGHGGTGNYFGGGASTSFDVSYFIGKLSDMNGEFFSTGGSIKLGLLPISIGLEINLSKDSRSGGVTLSIAYSRGYPYESHGYLERGEVMKRSEMKDMLYEPFRSSGTTFDIYKDLFFDRDYSPEPPRRFDI